MGAYIYTRMMARYKLAVQSVPRKSAKLEVVVYFFVSFRRKNLTSTCVTITSVVIIDVKRYITYEIYGYAV